MLPRCIVIGASAGGYEVLKLIASQLPANLAVPVFIVLHVAPLNPSFLPEILRWAGPLPAVHPMDGAYIEPGIIHVAPPDHHLLIDNGRVAVKRGPKENGFRPSIDALFRSAAYSYGPGAIGVVLSGALHDGASGLWSIKRLGGIAIVQDPGEAQYPSMPRSALEYVEADYTLKSTEIAPMLVRLAATATGARNIEDNRSEDATRMAKETQIAAGVNLPERNVLELGSLSPFTCPECRGALVRISEGGMIRFRCHTGHGFSADALIEGVTEKIGELIWQTVRGFQEAHLLLEHLGNHMQELGYAASAERFLAKAGELNKRASTFQRTALEQESLSSSNIAQGQPNDRS